MHQPTSRLDEIEAEVFRAVDRMCLRVGELLYEAKTLDPGGFGVWVKTKMPFGYDTARRLIAIYLAYRELPAERLAQLPRPWQAMYALSKFVQTEEMAAAIASGEIGPNTTVEQARRIARRWGSNRRTSTPRRIYSVADRRAGALMEFQPDDLNPAVREELTRWLHRASTPEDAPPASE